MHYFLNIGSNLGNPLLNISRAVRAIEAEFGYFELSRKVESAPWGYESPNRFTNVAMMIISDHEPLDVLHTLRKIEQDLGSGAHRTATGKYADRLIDIDIMATDELQIDTPELTLPHPHLHERTFFLEPFAEIAPIWRHPGNGLTCAEMLETLNQKTGDSAHETAI